MKIFFAILIALSLLALCACGAPAQQSATEPAPTEAPTLAPTESEETEPDLVAYSVAAFDEYGAAVSGVSVQIEDKVMTTDDTGMASFLLPEGTYIVTISELPEGYTISGEEDSFVLTEEARYTMVDLRTAEGTQEDTEMIEEEEPVIEDTPEETLDLPVEELPEE